MRLTHCGRMIFHSVCRRENASERAASHCAVGIDCTAPRTISATLAMIGSARPSVALIQSGNGIVTPPTWNSNGIRNITKNSSTSHGALRKNWTTTHDAPRTGAASEMRAKPSSTPATVPTIIANTLISRLNRNPCASSGVHLHEQLRRRSACPAPPAPARARPTRANTREAARAPGARRSKQRRAPLDRIERVARRRQRAGERGGSTARSAGAVPLIARTPARAGALRATASPG